MVILDQGKGKSSDIEAVEHEVDDAFDSIRNLYNETSYIVKIRACLQLLMVVLVQLWLMRYDPYVGKPCVCFNPNIQFFFLNNNCFASSYNKCYVFLLHVRVGK
jgi:hypothetical protein